MTEVTCALIMDGDEILITQRSESMKHPLKWEFPGGKLKPGESPEKCIIREIQEELNARITVERMLPTVLHKYENGTIKLIPFICELHSDSIVLQQHKAFAWVKSSRLFTYNLLEADLKILDNLLAG